MIDVPGEAPSVFAEFAGPGPTVLLYAHYDVQPRRRGWDEAFTPTLRDGRLYGRGAADDKSGIVAHLAALRAFDGRPPVHVKVLIEGSEENGRQRLLEVVDRDPELMRADVMVIADSGNWRLGEPTLCETLRGHGKLTVTLRTLDSALHSGQFGGAAPDALLALTRLLATLHDDAGAVAVGGPAGRRLGGRRPARGGLPPPGRRARRRRAGRHRQRRRPPVGAPRDLRARARRARRRGRGQHRDPGRAGQGRGARAARRGPWALDGGRPAPPARRARRGARTSRSRSSRPATPIALPAMAAAERALEAAYGKPVARMGSGGSIPLVAKLRETYPDAAFVLWGAQDSDLARIHAANESVGPRRGGEDRARRGDPA